MKSFVSPDNIWVLWAVANATACSAVGKLGIKSVGSNNSSCRSNVIIKSKYYTSRVCCI